MKLESKRTNNQSSIIDNHLAMPSTPVENVLQISPFMQNKPNSPNVQLNLTLFITMIYTIFTSLTKVKNKPNQTQNTQISIIQRYIKINPPSGAKKQTQFKPNFKNSNFQRCQSAQKSPVY
jgi:hypothetical protein